MNKFFLALSLIPFFCFSVSADTQRDVAELVRRLQKGDVDERERAAQALGQMGPEAEGAIGALRKALNDDFPYVRIRSAEALSKIGLAAIPAFTEALKNQNSEVRAIAASALGQYGPQAAGAIPDLVKALEDSDSPVRQRAAHALEQMGPTAAAAVMDHLESVRGHARLLDLQILTRVQTSDGAIVQRLIAILEDSDPQVRMAGAKALLRQSRKHIPELQQGLNSENPVVRAAVADVLADSGKSGTVAVPALTDLLKDPVPQVRGSAARALGKMGSGAASAVPALREAAKDADSSVATKAAEALTNITDVFGNESGSETKAVPAAVPAAPLPVSVQKPMPKKKAPAPKIAPKKIKPAAPAPPPEPPPATPQELLVQLQSTDTVASSMAAQMMIERSSETTPVLVQTLQDANTVFSAISADVLEKIGSDEAKSAVDAYRVRLSGKRTALLLKDLRQEGKASADAIQELAKIGAPIVTPVAQVLTDPRPSSRLAAATLLNRLGSLAAPAAPSLMDALEDKDPNVRAQAAEALAKIGTPEAKKALRFFPIKDKIRRLIGVFIH